MQKSYIIGINSGTSFDGIDVALVKFGKKNLKPNFIDGIVYKYPKVVKERLRQLITGESRGRTFREMPLQAISQLNFLLGELFSQGVLEIIKKNKLKPEDILLVASHGQTIYHQPEIEAIGEYKTRSTFQIGESSIIAQKTGITTISNFREADIGAGGQGAPLMPYLDWIIFNESKEIKLTLNIGGITNITIVGKNITPIAFDIGPGNALIDLAIKRNFNKELDKDGKIAEKGEIFYAHVENALNDKYFKKNPPKTTGKEYFNIGFIEKYFSGISRKEDRIATLTYLTSRAIQQALIDFVFPKYNVAELVISGGGIKNKTLMKHLMLLLPDLKFTTSDEYGLPSKYKEAILFALLGYTCNKGITNNLPSCTGAKKKVVLGKMTFV